MADFLENAYPQYAKAIRELAKRHRQLKDEPLLLAIVFKPESDEEDDIHVMEVLENFGGDLIDAQKEFFQASFTLPEDRSLGDKKLVLVLTNPKELKEAGKEKWSSFKTIQNAIKQNNVTVLYKDRKLGDSLLNLLTQGAVAQ